MTPARNVTTPAQSVTVMPQAYPLWAVRACSIEDTAAEVGLVIGWQQAADSAIRHPVVAALGDTGFGRGAARDWPSEVVRSKTPGHRWVELVEIYPTLEQAQERFWSLFKAAGEHHDRLWPEDAPGAGA